jgi:lysophospholipase L1-like esterase
MAVSYEDIVQGAYGSIGRTGIGTGAGTIDQEGYNFWLNALKEGAVTPDQLLANFNQAVAGTIQQQPQAANSQAVAAYIEANPLATQIDPKKVVAVGDSTTWGYSDGNQVTENMVTTAQKALGSDYSVSNLGINSTTAGDFLNSSDFDKALSSGAGTVVLNYGMNEAYKNVDPATFANNLLTAVQTLQAVGKKVILQTPNATGSSTKPEDAWTQNVGTYADVVRSVSQQTGSTLDDKFNYTSTLKSATSPTDIVHPTATTYGLLGTNLADAIKTTTTGVAPKAISVTPPVAAAQAPSLVTNQAASPVNPTVKLFQDTLGRAPSEQEIKNFNFGDTVDARELDKFLGFARNEAVDTLPTTGAAANIANQILAQGTTSLWAGEGFGSAQKNAYDMGVMLAGQGLTNINQFGKVTKEVPDYDPDGNQIGTKVITQFINKTTGQPINTYYDKAETVGPDIWGGTFAGKDSTAYGVQFDPAGNPVFYSQSGGDSSDAGDWMPIIQFALAASGAGGALGSSLLGAGAGAVASNALGNAILGGLTTGIAGGDVLKGTLLGGASGALSGYLQGGPIDASNMTSAQFNDALEGQLIGEMQRSGLTNAQITQFLENASVADIASITSKLPVTGASDTLLVNAARTPITATDLINTLAQIPTVVTTATKPEQVSPDVLNAVTSILGGATTPPPNVDVTAERPVNPDIPVITPITTPVVTTPTITTPTVTTPTGTTPTTKDTSLTASDVIRIIGIGTTLAGINAATSGGGTSGGVQYPIVDIPSGWSSTTATKVAPATVLPPINFGDRNLLIGTQWEKFLDPNYGQVPEPIQYSQPSSLSYNDLMGILGSKQGMPSASTLSINDIISGIQNQYGQARTGTMG